VFDRYMIIEDSLRPIEDGFTIDVRITYYRSLALSMIEGFEVTVDGKPIPPDDIWFVLRDTTYTLDGLEDEADTRWEFGEIATLRVHLAGGLREGPHTVGVVQDLRVVYMPGGSLQGRDTKTFQMN
jgi:hypothetical protein